MSLSTKNEWRYQEVKRKTRTKSLLKCSLTGFERRVGLQEAARKIEVTN